MTPVLALALLAALAGSAQAAAKHEAQPEFVGWRGDSFDPEQVFNLDPAAVSSTRPVQISEAPIAYLWPRFLAQGEARHIIELAAPRMMRSLVGGGQAINEVRTSYGMFLRRHHDAVVSAVQRRVSAWLGVPVDFQEDTQILRYGQGQMYKPHMDSNGRMCTVLIYLTDVAKGGETAFPNTDASHWLSQGLKPNHTASTCASNHVYAAPRAGDALLFYSLPPGIEKSNPEGAEKGVAKVDPFSMHTGCPPEEGLKWTATFWVHAKPFRPESYTEEAAPPLPDPALCADFHEKCKEWADAGECDNNAPYMRGSNGSAGQCRKACGVCTPCKVGDAKCEEEARAAQGFLPNLSGELAELFPDNQ